MPVVSSKSVIVARKSSNVVAPRSTPAFCNTIIRASGKLGVYTLVA
ncbi:MAG: hypothetical protein AB7G06_04565 [Bdellovibrionales bacterium]